MRNHLRLALVLLLSISTVGVVAPSAEATPPTPCYITDGTVITGYGTCSGAVVIASGITEIGYTSFMDAPVTSIDIPSTVKNIAMYAFYENESLTSVTLHEGLETITTVAFAHTRITSVVIPNSVKSIGEGAFYGDSYLTSVTIGTGISEIANDVFVGIKATSITIPANVKSIGLRAFKWADSLTAVSLPEGLLTIGADAFQATTALTSITMPSSVYSLDPNSFQGSNYSVPADVITRVAATAVARALRIEEAAKFEADRKAAEIRAAARSRALDALKAGKEPSAEDLLQADFNGINSRNVSALLGEISATSAKTLEDIEKSAKKVVLVEKLSGESASIMALPKSDLAAIGIAGMDGAYKAAILRSIANASPEKRGSFEGIQAVASKALAEAENRKARVVALISRAHS